MPDSVKYTFAVIGGAIATLLGGFDTILKCLLCLMVIDVVCGFTAAAIFNVSKYSRNGLTSDAMLEGGVRKGFILVVVVIGYLADKAMNLNYVRNMCVMYFICSEALSILETLMHCNVPFPKFLKDLLQSLLEREDNGEHD